MSDERTPQLARTAAGAVTGIVAGLGMYVVLTAFSLSQGRGAAYPFQAVQALMSGARVLPDHPRESLIGPTNYDAVLGPFYFFLPAVVVGVLVATWSGRRSDSGRRPALVPLTLAVTAVTFCLTVLVLGFQQTELAAQRSSTGYGVRELGMLAWVVAHVAYAALFAGLLLPVAAWIRHRKTRRSRRRAVTALRGD